MATSFALLFGLLSLDMHATWFASLKLALGTLTIGEGLLLATNWQNARQFTLWRLRRHHSAPRPALARLTGNLGSLILQLLGVIWLASGLLAVLLGLQGLT